MSQSRATRAGLAACAVICTFTFLYTRDPRPNDDEEEHPYPPVVDCGFYPDELCSALFEQKTAAPQVARFCKTPHGPALLAYFRRPGNCSRVSQGLRLITRPLSTEEGNFSLAYIISLQKELAMFVRLLRAIYAPQNVYCVHIDEKAPKKYKRAVQTLADCFGNIFIGFRRQEAAADSLTRLQAEISCMSHLLQPTRQWRYVMNLDGQDFPLKTNREITRYLKSKGHNNNVLLDAIPALGTDCRTDPPKHSPKGDSHAIQSMRSKRKPPSNFTISSEGSHYALTRKFVEFVLTDPRAKDMLQWVKDVHHPEWCYWAALNPLKDAPGAAADAGWKENIGAIKRRWEGDGHDGCKGHYDQDTCVYGLGDLAWLLRSPALFASKFEPSAEPLLVDCLERRHRVRALRDADGPVESHWHFPQESHFNR